jgi:hypothetical protein
MCGRRGTALRHRGLDGSNPDLGRAIGAPMAMQPGDGSVGGMPRRRRKPAEPQPTAKPQTSDQAPGEEVVQVNDQYSGGGPAPETEPSEHDQHPTGG